MAVIVAGYIVLGVPSTVSLGTPCRLLAILGACPGLGSGQQPDPQGRAPDATWLAAVKGCVAGSINLMLGFGLGATMPPLGAVGGAMVVGLFAYGVSLALFIAAPGRDQFRAWLPTSQWPRPRGAAGALGEPVTWSLVAAAALMGLGVWLHLSERHEHVHTHEAITHTHWHVHDEHHDHSHADGPVPTTCGIGTSTSRADHAHSPAPSRRPPPARPPSRPAGIKVHGSSGTRLSSASGAKERSNWCESVRSVEPGRIHAARSGSRRGRPAPAARRRGWPAITPQTAMSISTMLIAMFSQIACRAIRTVR